MEKDVRLGCCGHSLDQAQKSKLGRQFFTHSEDQFGELNVEFDVKPCYVRKVRHVG